MCSQLKLLISTLKDFFYKHPLFNPKTFLGDAAFDTVKLYKDLLTGNTFGGNKPIHADLILAASHSLLLLFLQIRSNIINTFIA